MAEFEDEIIDIEVRKDDKPKKKESNLTERQDLANKMVGGAAAALASYLAKKAISALFEHFVGESDDDKTDD